MNEIIGTYDSSELRAITQELRGFESAWHHTMAARIEAATQRIDSMLIEVQRKFVAERELAQSLVGQAEREADSARSYADKAAHAYESAIVERDNWHKCYEGLVQQVVDARSMQIPPAVISVEAPGGFVFAPLEPTSTMCVEGSLAVDSRAHHYSCDQLAVAYRAMIAARPAFPNAKDATPASTKA